MLPSPQWHFERFRLDPDNARLWHAERSIDLSLKAFGVLHYLVTHAGQLVTKEAFLDALWPNTAVSDASLRMAIREIRRALGDAAQAPRFIATVHRLGYRFLPPVRRIERAAISPESGLPTPMAFPTPADLGSSGRLLVTALCCVLPSGSTMNAEMGFDDLHRLLHLASNIALKEVQQYKGPPWPAIGGGFLALFGVFVAEENHA
jgi:DNA-binding winged helix-turn-helix (wHTH) protein